MAVSLQLVRWFQNEDAEALVIITGYFLAAIINPLANLWAFSLLFRNKAALLLVPRWLLIANFIFFLLQIIYLIHLNGTQHP